MCVHALYIISGPSVPDQSINVPAQLSTSSYQASVALWFGSIGPGFWQYGGTHGFLGTSWAHAGEAPDHETLMTLSTLATVIFLVAFAGVAGLWGLLVGGGEEGEEEGEGGLPPPQGRGQRRARGGYVELSKRGGSVDGREVEIKESGGAWEEGLEGGEGRFRIADEEAEAEAVVL